jgi:hypothetical protein
VEEIVLPPYSHSKVTSVKNNAEWWLYGILADDYYLFWGNDPLSAPPKWKDISKIGDINTGETYLESYAKLRKNLVSRCYSP